MSIFVQRVEQFVAAQRSKKKLNRKGATLLTKRKDRFMPLFVQL